MTKIDKATENDFAHFINHFDPTKVEAKIDYMTMKSDCKNFSKINKNIKDKLLCVLKVQLEDIDNK